MRPAIKDIFLSWKRSLLAILLLMSLITFTAIEENTSFKKIENLQKQRELIDLITETGRSDLGFANIQYRGKSEMLHFLVDQLSTFDSYDLIGKSFADHYDEYQRDLKSLKEMTKEFIHVAGLWYAHEEKGLSLREKEMHGASERLLGQIGEMIIRNSLYDSSRSMLQQLLIYVTLLLIFLHLISFHRRSTMILKDIDSLHLINADASAYTPVTDEITIISKRMGRRPSASENPSLMDSITEINNLKGLLYAYANKKNVKDGSYVAVATFEVDGLEQLDKEYSVEFTQALLKKIAFMISLHQQPADIIGRTDYSQFTVIFTRNDRNQALKDCQLIMNSVKETAFKTPKGHELSLTLSTGFAPKHSSTSIDESMTHAKKALDKAKAEGPNRLIQS